MQNIKKIININNICQNYSQCSHLVKYVDTNDFVCENMIPGKDIWDFYLEKNLLSELNYLVFKHLSIHCHDQSLVKNIEIKILNKIKKTGLVHSMIERSLDLIDVKHSNPIISYTKKYIPTSARLTSNFISLDLLRDNNCYIGKWNNDNI